MKANNKVWDVILKVIIAAVSALAGALGANAMNL
ncbi:smalltalk protein [Bacteroides sp. 519]|nr:smalltalk protein [Bacteroides sp. 519]